jgi:large subunit ribosomal protein L25
MKTFDLKGVVRTDVGKKATKELRANEKVPCVLYGGNSVTHFIVEGADLRHLVYSPNVYIVNLSIDGKASQAIMKDIQFNGVTDAIEHIDFLQVTDDKKITVLLPVQLNGLAEGVKQGGKLVLKQRLLKVKAFAKDMPDILNVDVTELGMGKSIKVGDLNFANLEVLNAKNAVVTTIKLTRSAMSAKQEAGKK